jgi:hypothetical protein
MDKRRMGDDLKNQILVHNGIISEESAAAQRKPSVLSCARCNLINAVEYKFCSKCSTTNADKIKNEVGDSLYNIEVALRPSKLCFVSTPFGKRNSLRGSVIDFDAVYEQLIAPAIKEAGLEPLRADEEMTGGIIQAHV